MFAPNFPPLQKLSFPFWAWVSSAQNMLRCTPEHFWSWPTTLPPGLILGLNRKTQCLLMFAWRVLEPGSSQESGYRPPHRACDHKTQTTREGIWFGLYSRWISSLVPGPNVHHSDSSWLSHCTKTFFREGEGSPTSLQEEFLPFWTGVEAPWLLRCWLSVCFP